MRIEDETYNDLLEVDVSHSVGDGTVGGLVAALINVEAGLQKGGGGGGQTRRVVGLSSEQ